MDKSPWDEIRAGQPGSAPHVPYTHAPDDWEDEGVPYGAWCVCLRCGWVGRSTFTFDYSAECAGDPLTCERCDHGTSYAADILMTEALEKPEVSDD